MKLQDYINGRRGREIISNWGGAVLILVVLFLTSYIVIHKDLADIPPNAQTLLMVLMGLLGLGTAVNSLVNKTTTTTNDAGTVVTSTPEPLVTQPAPAPVPVVTPAPTVLTPLPVVTSTGPQVVLP